ncbi:uncharacterized protein OCT59_010184 [Rhizophagus irregularis]|uniref:Serine-threonine/tyrosine-protein kinase catalytic domain-containing protein n=1 Tax=Rhizophagus irregularis TaxID=588596 RepID=A0A916A0E7_9GLOM|nr:hypothetical protein OCT59_010184 [Rhizophagus irregularis]CAB4387057.1 unnamed protein product [Rhizophagus irregularis]CAB4460678.1 unnamed protein product [Rhizophagus irregularis]CAB5164437.1 unnamed protein product [Rhizophagus irregularis]CAB5396070.1 unnamed protein product [Rhizophagus irregularis]
MPRRHRMDPFQIHQDSRMLSILREEGTIYKAVWNDGLIVDWDDNVQEYVRSKSHTIALKCIDKNENMSDAYLQEAKTLFSFRVHESFKP